MIDVTNNRIPHWLKRRAEASPNAQALLAGGEWLTWAELYDRSVDLATRLFGLGLEPGGRVALLAANSREFVEVAHAVSLLGATLVPLNARLTAPELAWQINDIQAGLLLYDERHAGKTEEISGSSSCPVLAIAGLAELPAGHFVPQDYIDLTDLHTIIYSSGTTGKPKGVMLTYGNHFWNAMASVLNLGLNKNDRWLAVLPLFHVGGLSILLRSAIYGIPAIVHESFDPVAVNRAIDEDGVTIVSVVANILQRTLEDRNGRPYPATLRCMLAGGGPVPLPLLERCTTQNIPVTQTYGMTETASQVATLAPEDALRKTGSAGKALYPSELIVAGENGPLLPGEVGEILVRGPVVTAGYAGRPEETARAFKEGWLHTGDLGRLDDEGYLYVVDRRTDLIISGGENVYPAEVEAVLLSHPAVEEAGVVGLPDERWGQVVGAFIKLRPGADLSAAVIIEWCRERLARYKVPSQVIFTGPLPRNAAGKLLRRELRDNWPKLAANNH